MAKVWEVQVVVSGTMFVCAESAEKARVTAESVIPRAAPPFSSLTTNDGGSIPLDAKNTQIAGVAQVRADQLSAADLNSMPWGRDDELTVGDILAKE